MSETEPSKAWYLFPIMLWTIGGLISFLSLRKRNIRMAYKSFLLGILMPVMFFSVVALGAYSNNDSSNIDNNDDKQNESSFNVLTAFNQTNVDIEQKKESIFENRN